MKGETRGEVVRRRLITIPRVYVLFAVVTVLLPVLLSYVRVTETSRTRLRKRAAHLAHLWEKVAMVAERRRATAIIVTAVGLLIFGVWKGSDVRIGDLHAGVPELRPSSRYNIDSQVISDRFSIGVDVISVIVETVPEGCIDYHAMSTIDDFHWHMRNVEGVRRTASATTTAARHSSAKRSPTRA